MGKAPSDLPDPLQTPVPGKSDADDLLARMAGDEIDRLLAEAEIEAPAPPRAARVEAPPLVAAPAGRMNASASSATHGDAPRAARSGETDEASNRSPKDVPPSTPPAFARRTPPPKPALAFDTDPMIAAEIDALFDELTRDDPAPAPKVAAVANDLDTPSFAVETELEPAAMPAVPARVEAAAAPPLAPAPGKNSPAAPEAVAAISAKPPAAEPAAAPTSPAPVAAPASPAGVGAPSVEQQLDALFAELNAQPMPEPAAPSAVTSPAAAPSPVAPASASSPTPTTPDPTPELSQQLDDLFKELTLGDAVPAAAAVPATAANPTPVVPEDDAAANVAERRALSDDPLDSVGLLLMEHTATLPVASESLAAEPDPAKRRGFVSRSFVRVLELLNAPVAACNDAVREAVGKVAIMTLINAIAVLLYVVVFRK